jgi:hypothetical protein
LGWTDSRNVRVDYRWGGGDADRVRKYAAELLALRPNVVFAGGGAVEELLRATSAVPIVFAIVPDPVGFVDSLSRPALRNYRIPAFAALANATGVRFAHLPFTPDRIFDKLGVATCP